MYPAMKIYIKMSFRESIEERYYMDDQQCVAAPVFFPFTALTRQDKEIFSSLFSQTVVLDVEPPWQRVDNDPWFHSLNLPEKVMEEVESAFHEYTTWADMNRGAGRGYLRSIWRDIPYFKSDTDISAIRTQIERASVGEITQQDVRFSKMDKREAGESELQRKQSLLFLRLAHHFDNEHDRLDQTLSSIDMKESLLLDRLRGVDGDDKEGKEKKRVPQDRGKQMTRERILAWNRVMQWCFPHDLARIRTTSSPAVIDFFESFDEKKKLILDIDPITVHKETCSNRAKWQVDFLDGLNKAILGKSWSMDMANEMCTHCDCDLVLNVQLYLFSGDRIGQLLGNFEEDGRKNEFNQDGGDWIPILLVTANE